VTVAARTRDMTRLRGVASEPVGDAYVEGQSDGCVGAAADTGGTAVAVVLLEYAEQALP